MAREILFKAKRIDNGEWVEGSLITGVFCRLGQDIPYIFCPNEADYYCFEDFSEENGIFEVQPHTICQYTGLTDKNGKKIWENDIVEIPKEDEYFKIEWQEDTASFVMVSDSLIVTFNNYWNYEVEVYGNSFDNPKLLGGDTQ